MDISLSLSILISADSTVYVHYFHHYIGVLRLFDNNHEKKKVAPELIGLPEFRSVSSLSLSLSLSLFSHVSRNCGIISSINITTKTKQRNKQKKKNLKNLVCKSQFFESKIWK